MRRHLIFPHLCCALIVFFCSSALSGGEFVAACERAPIEEWSPTEAAWCSAVGLSKIRFREQQGKWIAAHEPRWTSDALVVSRPLFAPTSTLFAIYPHNASSETLRIAWSEIERLDRYQGNHAAQGVMIGGLVGLASAGLLTRAHEEGAAYYFALGLPISLVAGAIIGTSIPRWDPAYCKSSIPNPD